MLRDNEPSSDIPYVVTAGRCLGGGEIVGVVFWLESKSCNSAELDSRYQIVTAPIYVLASQIDTSCSDAPDWALLRFNLMSEVSVPPALLLAKADAPTANIYQLHHPHADDLTRYSQGTLTSGGVYRQ